MLLLLRLPFPTFPLPYIIIFIIAMPCYRLILFVLRRLTWGAPDCTLARGNVLQTCLTPVRPTYPGRLMRLTLLLAFCWQLFQCPASNGRGSPGNRPRVPTTSKAFRVSVNVCAFTVMSAWVHPFITRRPLRPMLTVASASAIFFSALLSAAWGTIEAESDA